ncbi:MAG: hypothetical protein R2695_13820 [Acidimicrobiales bacterium]
MILHDVGWPYGRRDLYYDPPTSPEGLQPHARKGMSPKRTHLLNSGGMNVDLHNALEEGGPRNGVRTGLDDFVAEHAAPLRQIVIPTYYGLAIVAEEAFLAAHPAVAELMDELESPAGTSRLVDLAESIRIDEVVFSHNIERMRHARIDRGTQRYLALLRSALLDRHYLENEDRISSLLECAQRGSAVNRDHLRAPANFRAARCGSSPPIGRPADPPTPATSPTRHSAESPCASSMRPWPGSTTPGWPGTSSRWDAGEAVPPSTCGASSRRSRTRPGRCGSSTTSARPRPSRSPIRTRCAPTTCSRASTGSATGSNASTSSTIACV